MYAHFLRQSLLGLLSLTLVLPASVLHVCRCTRSAPTAVVTPTHSELRPCCVKRAAPAKPAAHSSSPEISSKCCCGELRWNQTITQSPPSRAVNASVFQAMPVMKFVVAKWNAEWNSIRQTFAESLAPDDPLQITLGRWQI